MILVIALLLNYKLNVSEHYNKCLSENPNSTFCAEKILEVKKSQATLEKFEKDFPND